MPDFSKSVVYKLSFGDLVYYGSTTQPTLAHRLAGHTYAYKKWIQNPDLTGYCSSYKLFEFGKPEIELVERVTCVTRDELHARERFYIKNYPCVNKHIPLRKPFEYYCDNRERISEYKKTYYIENRETRLDYQRAYEIRKREESEQTPTDI